MKTKLYLLILLVGNLTFAQSISFNYKALLTDNSGNALSNQSVNIRFTIYNDDPSSGGTIEYQETMTKQTDANGIVIAEIGNGNSVAGNLLTDLTWTSDIKYIKTEFDIGDGNGYQEIDTKQFHFTPYALLSLNAANAQNVPYSGITNKPSWLADGDNDNQTLSVSGNQLTISNGNTVTLPTGSGGDQWGSQVVQSDASLSGDGTSANPLSVDTNSNAFNGWDKNANDDFSGDFTDLTNKPLTWKTVGGNNPSTSDTDDIFRTGKVIIGAMSLYSNPNHQLYVNNAGTNNNELGIVTKLSGTGTGLRTALYNVVNNSGTGNQTGVYNLIRNSNNGEQTGVINDIQLGGSNDVQGIYNKISGGSAADHYGVKNELTGTGTGIQYGTKNYINNSGNASHYGNFNKIEGGGSGPHYGSFIWLRGIGTGDQFGTQNYINNSANGAHYGSYSFLSGTGSGDHFGSLNWLQGTGTGKQYGVKNKIENSGDAIHYGSYTELSGGGSGAHYGGYQYLTGTGTGIQYALFNSIDNSANTPHYGLYNSLSGAGAGSHLAIFNWLKGNGSGVQYGIRNIIDNTGNNNHYGTYSELRGTGSGPKFGSYNKILTTAGGTHYAVYGEATKAGSFAGYFVGDVKMTQKLKGNISGDADMKAYVYGYISASGSNISIDANKSSSGFSVQRIVAGKYRVTLTQGNLSDYMITANAIGTSNPKFVTYYINSNSNFDIYIWKLDGTLDDSDVSFVIYKK